MKNIISFFNILIFVYACNNNGPSLEQKEERDNNNFIVIADGDDIDSSQNIGDINDEQQSEVIDEYFSDPVVQSYQQESDTLIISEDCVVFLWPDSLEIEELKKTNPDSFEQILNTRIEKASEIAIVLDSLNIKNFFCDKYVICFIGSNKDYFINRKKENADIFLYKFNNKPLKLKYEEYNLDTINNFFSLVKSTVTLEEDSIK